MHVSEWVCSFYQKKGKKIRTQRTMRRDISGSPAHREPRLFAHINIMTANFLNCLQERKKKKIGKEVRNNKCASRCWKFLFPARSQRFNKQERSKFRAEKVARNAPEILYASAYARPMRSGCYLEITLLNFEVASFNS